MKLADYVAQFVAQQGIHHVFGLTGGAVVHLFDSVARNPNINPVFTHHEQAAALAAVSYSRVTENLGAVIVTTGPGCTNALTGLVAAWQDSIPCIFISGQSRKEHTTHGTRLRQLGSQELDIISIVKPITKYAAMLEGPETIRYHLEKAVYFAKEGRPGPVWIDIPLNFQWAFIEPSTLASFHSSEQKSCDCCFDFINQSVKKCLSLAIKAQRPLVLAGYGIRLGHAVDEFRQFVDRLRIPFVASWTASDMVPADHPLFTGRLGVTGQRGANLAVQNCDFLLCLGSHLSIPLTGTVFKAFARDASIVMVDIDEDELGFKTVPVDLSIRCDVKIFLAEMLRQEHAELWTDISCWREKCASYKKYNFILSEWKRQERFVNPYVFVDALSDKLDEGDLIVVDGGGTNLYISFQAFKVKENQRLLLSSGICSMGTGLPESIGACFAVGKRRTICLSGDGSLQLNIQELQTIIHHNLPIKVFVLNNGGYLAIRHTQADFLNGNFVGSCESGGLSFPDSLKVAEAYGLRTMKICSHSELSEKLDWVLDQPGPIFCEIMVSPEQQLFPRQGFRPNPDGTYAPRPLEEMYPYLEPQEFMNAMIVDPWSE